MNGTNKVDEALSILDEQNQKVKLNDMNHKWNQEMLLQNEKLQELFHNVKKDMEYLARINKTMCTGQGSTIASEYL